MRKGAFTLLEILIALFLLSITGSALYFSLGKKIEAKRFRSEMEILESRFIYAKKMAIAMDADWVGSLVEERGDIRVFFRCIELEGKDFKSIALQGPFELKLNSKKVEHLDVFFTASGGVFPRGTLSISKGKHSFSLEF